MARNGGYLRGIFLAAGLALLVGCGKPPEAQKTRILYTVTDTDDAYRTTLANAIKAEAQAQDVILDIRYAGGSTDAQTDAVLAANREHFDAVIVFPVDPGDVLELEEAAGDMPIVFVNNKPSDDVLSRNHYMYVGSDEASAGEFQARFVWEKLGRPSKLTGLIFKGEPGHSGTMGRTAAVKGFFEQNSVDAEWVYEDYAHWSDTEAADKFTIFLNRDISFDAVFSNNDTMALGVVSVMKERGLDPQEIPVVGVDATVDGCRSIQEGGISFTVFQNGEGQGGNALRLAKQLAETGSADGFEGLDDNGVCVWVPFEPVDASNVDEYITR